MSAIAPSEAEAMNLLIWPDGAVRVAENVFPAIFHNGSSSINPVRVFLAQAPDDQGWHLSVWQDTPRGPGLVHEGAVDVVDTSSRERVMRSLDGASLRYSLSGHCGCGSRLRSFSPWTARTLLVAIPRA